MNPSPLIGVAGLMRLALTGMPLQALVDRAATNPDPADMMMGLSCVFQLFGKKDESLEMQKKALHFRRIFTLRCENPKRRLLVLMKEGDMQDNTPVDFLVSETDLLLFYSSDEFLLPEAMPEHDSLFVAMGESSDSVDLLKKVSKNLENWPKPVLNRPERILETARDNACRLLSPIEGLFVPHTEKISRNSLSSKSFPFIARPVDSHAGRNLERFETQEEVENYLSRMDEEIFYASSYVDYRSRDGFYRKYRIAMVKGKPYPCHLAINHSWMVSYRNSEMEKSIEKRAEEAEFMTEFSFGKRHSRALERIFERIGLDYFVIDCGEFEGKLLLFEVDNRAFVHDMDPPEFFPYKKPAMQKLFSAFESMLDQAPPNTCF